jgi:hypothetical protein
VVFVSSYAVLRDGSLNISASFKTEEEALKALGRGDDDLVRECSLEHIDAEGHWSTVAAGQSLVGLVRTTTTRPRVVGRQSVQRGFGMATRKAASTKVSAKQSSTSRRVASEAGKELRSTREPKPDRSVAASDLRQASKRPAQTSKAVAKEAGKELASDKSTGRERSVAGSDLRQSAKRRVRSRARPQDQ